MKSSPARMGLVQGAFNRDLMGRFTALMQSIQKAVGEENLFRVGKESSFFDSHSSRLKNFKDWVEDLLQKSLLRPSLTGELWAIKYIQTAHKRGVSRAFKMTRTGKKLTGSLALSTSEEGWMSFQPSSQEDDFVDSILRAHSVSSRRDLHKERLSHALRDIVASLSSQLARQFAEALFKNDVALSLSNAQCDTIRKIFQTRAMHIPSVEVIRSHSEGMLDAFERFEIGKVKIQTRGECSNGACTSLMDRPHTIEQARGILPLHVGCVCCWAIF